MTAFMECGHAAQGVDDSGKPVCVVCFGIKPGATRVAEAPDLTGRHAECECGRMRESSTDLAFFAHQPDRPHDRFYCGCRGWD